jgi:hypothetical protein
MFIAKQIRIDLIRPYGRIGWNTVIGWSLILIFPGKAGNFYDSLANDISLFCKKKILMNGYMYK